MTIQEFNQLPKQEQEYCLEYIEKFNDIVDWNAISPDTAIDALRVIGSMCTVGGFDSERLTALLKGLYPRLVEYAPDESVRGTIEDAMQYSVETKRFVDFWNKAYQSN